MTALLVGLGNPGKKYAPTRHNAGKMFVQYLKKHPIKGLKTLATGCFMNDSGSWLKAKFSTFNFQFSNLFIAYDDLDLPLGEFKIQWGRGPRDHQGLNSIYEALGTKEFWHVRLGIATERFQRLKVSLQRAGGQSLKLKVKEQIGSDHVLKPFRKEEKRILEKVFGKIREKLVSFNFQ